MALHSGIDTVAVISFGVYSTTYGSADGGNIVCLFTSRGLFEDAPSPSIVIRTLRKWLTIFRGRR
jgi:hypothetical protein